jgi:translocation and assembly module TamA
MAKTHSFVVTGPYYTAFGPLRLDLATPLHKRCADSLIQVYISLGQAF